MQLTKITLATTTALLISSHALFAAGSDDSTPPVKTKTTEQCEEGYVYDEEEKDCVLIKESSLDDDAIYKNARELAYDGQYKNALDLLALAEDQNDPRILNYKGFSLRNSGDLTLAMTYYRQAIALDPKYTLARSYYGQALIKSGDREGARQQLTQIAMLDGKQNWAYWSLSNALKNGKFSNY